MQDFNIEKKGYNKDEVKGTIESLVQDYEERLAIQKERIDDLREQVEEVNIELDAYKSKDKNISGALKAAVATAEQIEKDHKNLYSLEIKKVRLLYNKWEDFLKEMMDKYPETKEDFDPSVLLKGFQNAIDQTIKANFNSMQATKKANNENARRNITSLLNKMTASRVQSYNRPTTSRQTARRENFRTPTRVATITRQPRPEQAQMQTAMAENYTSQETRRINGVRTPSYKNNENIKPITNLTLTGQDKYDNLVDKYLNTNNLESENFANNAYSKQLLNKEAKQKEEENKKESYSLYPTPNESGFDLKEALNPTENLSDIMKAFDFFDEDED